MSMRIAFRVDGNRDIGIGHISRCMTIANILLLNFGIESLFIVADKKSKEFVLNKGFETIELNIEYTDYSKETAKKLLAVLYCHNIKSIIFDSYSLNNVFLQYFEKFFKCVISSRQTYFYCDLLINYSTVICRDFYTKTYKNENTKLLLGSSYIPLKDEFVNNLYTVNKNVKNILILVGGSNQTQLIKRLLVELSKINNILDYNIKVVLGYFSSCKNFEYKYFENKINVEFLSFCNDISTLMSESDLIITAGGTTIYEIGSIGIPQLVFSIVEEQIPESQYLNQLNALLYVGVVDLLNTSFWQNFTKCFNEIVSSYEKRILISNNMKKIVDGKGAYRICNELLKIIGD